MAHARERIAIYKNGYSNITEPKKNDRVSLNRCTELIVSYLHWISVKRGGILLTGKVTDGILKVQRYIDTKLPFQYVNIRALDMPGLLSVYTNPFTLHKFKFCRFSLPSSVIAAALGL